MHNFLEIVAVAFERLGELSVFVQSILNQTSDRWALRVIHDGPNREFRNLMQNYKRYNPEKINFSETTQRYNDYGHSLRQLGIQESSAEFLMLTNADNYLIPRAVEYIHQAVQGRPVDVVLYDMIHSHYCPGGRMLPEYSYFETHYSRGSIDIGAAVVRTALAQRVGFRDKSHDGDASFFEDLVPAAAPNPLEIVKINRVLLVHN
jgi:hypothetical protein